MTFSVPFRVSGALSRAVAAAIVGGALAGPAHAAYHLTAFDGTAGFDEIMAADYDAARASLERPSVDLDRYARHANLCVSRLMTGEIDAALGSCQRAVDVAPADFAYSLGPTFHRKRLAVLTDLYSNRGVVKAMSGDLYGARADFERALRLDGDNANAQRNLDHLAAREVARSD